MTHEQVTELRILQGKARAGAMTDKERERWGEMRGMLERALNQAQLLLAPASARARRSFRVVCPLEVELMLGGAVCRARTTNFSTGGFSALLDREPERMAEGIPFVLQLSGSDTPVRGLVLCRGARKAGGQWRASFEFLDLAPQQRMQLELEVVDLQLEMLWPAGRLAP